jgi:hypothetical protein
MQIHILWRIVLLHVKMRVWDVCVAIVCACEFALTLIGPGEVKVDLADFDLKLQENLLSTLYFFYLFLQKRLPDLFELMTWPQKMTFWHPFWHIFVRNQAAASPAEPPLPPGFTAYTDHLSAGEVPPGHGPQSGAAPVKNSNQFPVAGRIECGWGGFSVVLALSLFLSGLLAPHRSGHVPETDGLYSAVSHHTHNSLRRPGSFNLDLIGRPLLVSSEV